MLTRADLRGVRENGLSQKIHPPLENSSAFWLFFSSWVHSSRNKSRGWEVVPLKEQCSENAGGCDFVSHPIDRCNLPRIFQWIMEVRIRLDFAWKITSWTWRDLARERPWCQKARVWKITLHVASYSRTSLMSVGTRQNNLTMRDIVLSKISKL